MTKIQKRLFEMQDLSYRDFHAKLMPTVDKNSIIGVRTPILRKYAKEVFGKEEYKAFLNALPHKYYEENNLHGFLIEQITDYDECIEEIEKFLPCIDNWATCDLLRPKALKKYPDKLLDKIKKWIKTEHIYTIRFGVEMLMCYYLDDNFDKEYPKLVAGIKSDEYYVNMMLAWYFATALAKRYDDILPYIENNTLSKWVHNKTIQKAVDSYRITDSQKMYLKSLKQY